MKKKWTGILAIALITIYLVLIFGFITGKRQQVVCNEVRVLLTDSTENYFINESHLLAMITAEIGHLQGQPINSINIAELEAFVRSQPAVKRAEIYKTIKGVLTIEIEQRTPIVRILNTDGSSYYLDEEGMRMPLSDKFTSRVLIASGAIEPAEFHGSLLTDTLTHDTATVSMAQQLIGDVYTLAHFVYHNTFWRAQIEQIYVTEEQEFELIPKVGPHFIVFGKADNYREKFNKLEVFYREGLNYAGWNQYKIINLKYKNQVVCEKR